MSHSSSVCPAASRRDARLAVRCADADVEAFRRAHDVDVEVVPLNLQGLFPLLVDERRR